MNTHHSTAKYKRSGFTLVEILVVIVIIGILAAITVGGVGFYNKKAAQSKTQVFVASVSRALGEYRSDEGQYPTDGADGSERSSEILYETLFGDANGDGDSDENATIYLDTFNPTLSGPALNVREKSNSYTLIDGFQNPLRYRAPGEQNPATEFDLWSAGIDGETDLGNTGDDTKDDVVNW